MFTELMVVIRPFVRLSDTDMVQVTVNGVTLTRSEVMRLVRLVSSPAPAIDRVLDVLAKAEAWVDGHDSEKGASNDLSVLRPYTEKMRRLAQDLEKAVEARMESSLR